jgi:hypothetical protein
VVHWDADGRKDLLVGRSDGIVMIFRNIGTDADPLFDRGARVQVGPPGSKSDIDVGARATSIVVDWNGDGREDLLVGALDGRVRLFLNEGAGEEPDFLSELIVQDSGADLVVPTGRSSPGFVDVTHDGRKDLVTGNTEGQLLLYENTGTTTVPSFSGYVLVEADGVAIDLPSSARSRPFVGQWTDDGVPDALIGAADGSVRAYAGNDVLTGVRPFGPFPPGAIARLLPARPNPFRGETSVPFELGRGGSVRVIVFDVTGRRIGTLVDGVHGEGPHEARWDGRGEDGRPVPAGIYFVRVEAGETTVSARLVRLR